MQGPENKKGKELRERWIGLGREGVQTVNSNVVVVMIEKTKWENSFWISGCNMVELSACYMTFFGCC